MGAVVGRLADYAVVTSDNPRGEEPLEIISQIESGMQRPHEVEPDRGRAIALAISQADAADVVLVAGKGHENYQEVAGRKLPFSDAETVRAALERRSAG